MLLVLVVDNGACILETRPDLFAELFGYRSNLTILLMQILQLMECAYHIRLFSELLCFLAELRLSLKIFS